MSEKKRVFLISAIVLYIFAILGQWIIEMIYHEINYSRQAESRLLMIVIASICAWAARICRQSIKIKPIWGKVFSAFIVACLMLFIGSSLQNMRETRGTYSTDNWIDDRYIDKRWTGALDWLEEGTELWRASRWFGRGAPLYPYDDGILKGAPENVDWETDEPYHGMLDNRARAIRICCSGESSMLLPLLCHRLGRWVWCLYLLIALVWTGSGLALLLDMKSRGELLLGIPAFCGLSVLLWLPILSCPGLVCSYHGPLFTFRADKSVLLQLLAIAPTLGALYGLAFEEEKESLLTRITEKLKAVF